MQLPKPARGEFAAERKRRKGKAAYRRRLVYAAVSARDQHRCRYCGRTDALSHHHIVPVSKGGPDATWNLVLLCVEHHNAAQNGTPRLVLIGNPDTRKLRFRWTHSRRR